MQLINFRLFCTYLIITQKYNFKFQIEEWLWQSIHMKWKKMFIKEYHMQKDILPSTINN